MRRTPDNWLTSSQAAKVLSANSGHNVSADYARLLGKLGKLKIWPVSSHVILYHRASVEAYRVKQRAPV